MASELATRIAERINNEAFKYGGSEYHYIDTALAAAIIDADLADVREGEGWRPIAEAGRGPNDFWWAFCPMRWRCPAEYRQIYWCDGQWMNAENDEPLKYQPTHFMPLPAPPVDRAAMRGEG